MLICLSVNTAASCCHVITVNIVCYCVSCSQMCQKQNISYKMFEIKLL